MTLQATIEAAWEDRANLTFDTRGEVRDAVDEALALLDRGEARVAEPDGRTAGGSTSGSSRRCCSASASTTMQLIDGDAEGNRAYDKVPSKFAALGRSQPSARPASASSPARSSAAARIIGKGAVLMPSFVNIGAYVGEGTMVDTWATVGSCAQIGRNVHICGGAGIGGVLEPLQANPVIIGDGAFIGARAEVAEGVRVGEGAVLSMGVYLGASTKIIDRATGEVFRGEVPPYAVVVPGSTGGGNLALYCAVIVKRVDAQTRSKTSINELLRD